MKQSRLSKRALIACLCFLAGALMARRAGAGQINVAGRAAVLMDAAIGETLWQRNAALALAPASTTKILTALLVLDKTKPGDLISVPPQAVKASGGSARLGAGELLTVEQLLYGMMLGSANDAALALAAHAAGSEAQFVSGMNHKARNLGAVRSSFRNPTGLPQQGHVSTAHDLAVITRAALANAKFRAIVGARTYSWQSAAWKGELKNSNLLLDKYPGAIGVKTGQTREAGFCLVAAAERGKKTLIAVILKSSQSSVWTDADTLLDYGFQIRHR
jgi:D-alanyl-D-alanine carboxypeptidase (penicillin-binding protein 5/6)